MLIDLYKHPERNFAFATFRGNIDNISLKNFILTYNETLVESPCLELVDLRELAGVDGLTVKGTIEASKHLKSNPGSKLAILIPESNLIYGMARAFQVLSEHRRSGVEIFKEKEAAIRWLDSRRMKQLYDWTKEPTNKIYSNN